MDFSLEPVSGLVLCGGQSVRMGRDKALLELDGIPLIQLQINRLIAIGCQEIFISGPKTRSYERFGKPIIEDHAQGAGPLAGLIAGLEAATTPLVFVLAVDLPDLRVEFLRFLMAHSPGHDVICPQSKDFFEPLCALYRRAVCLPSLQEDFAHGRRSLQDCLRNLRAKSNFRMITCKEWRAFGENLFRNWNTPNQS